MTEILKILNVIFFSSIKFFWTTPYAFLLGFGPIETFIYMMIGGSIGIVFFYFFGALIRYEWQVYHKKVERFLPVLLNAHIEKKILEEKILNSKKLRRIINLRRKFGLWGIIILTPILLSIPLGSILASKFFSKRKLVLLRLFLSLFVWGLISVGLFYLFPSLQN